MSEPLPNPVLPVANTSPAQPPVANLRRIHVAGDIVNAATSDLPDEQRSAIRWLHAHMVERDLSSSDAAKLIRYDESTLSRVFRGSYEGNLENVVKEITAYRRMFEARNLGRKLDFIETSLSRRISKICDAALEYQRIAFIFGETQTGKTTALRHYAVTHNHGSTIYVSMPTGGALSHFLEALAVALRIAPQQQERELRRRILHAFDDRMLLIVDEAHQCIIGGRLLAVKTLEFVREIYDASACGVVICGTNVLRDEMQAGRWAGILKQCQRRRLVSLQLPSVPTKAELDAFSAAYELEPASGNAARLQDEIIHDQALGYWLCLLRMAAKMAAHRKSKLTWTHVLKAADGLRSLEGNAVEEKE